MIENKHDMRKLKISSTPEAGLIWLILEVLRSTFLFSNGKTSFWSVATTSHPNNAIPGKKIPCQTKTTLPMELTVPI